MKTYYERNKKKFGRYYQANREARLAYGAQYRGAMRALKPWRMHVDNAKHRALARGVEFTLTHEWAAARWTGRCELSNIEFHLGGRGPRSASLGRLDSAKGYTSENCRFILSILNTVREVGADVGIPIKVWMTLL